ncbi:MAG: PAS domain S-box protein [Desulfosalsimonas sp.]|uniref:hybrid sensor histidine kinase/response regulator n=1 Tax=Desulfosalsimonas sp. TaxID=3073848 RepID=UPI0039711659
MLNSRFSQRIFLLFLVCIIIPVSLIFIYSYHHVGRQLDDQYFHRLHQEVRTTSLSIYERLLFLRAELNLISSRLPPGGIGPDDFSAHVENFLKGRAYDRFTGIMFRNGSSAIPVYGKIQNRPELSEKQTRMIRQGKTVLLRQASSGGRPLFYMVVPVVAKNPDKGLLFGRIAHEYLWGVGSMRLLPPMTHLFVLDSHDRLLIASGGGSPKEETLKRLAKSALQDGSGRIDWRYDGEDHVAVSRNLFLEGQFSEPGWTVVLSQSRDDIRTSLKDFKILYPLFSLLSLLIVLLISTIGIRRSLQPLAELKKTTRSFAEGKLDTKAEISSGDEFEELADAFNRMGTQLASQFDKLKLNAEIGRHMASTIDPRQLADKALESICRHLDFDGGFVGWYSPGSGEFMGSGSLGLSREQQQGLIEKCQFSLDSDGGASLKKTGSEDCQSTFAVAVGAEFAACLPLQFADQLAGIMIIFKYQAKTIPENTEEILGPIADELSVSLSNLHSLSRFLESENKFRSIFENSAAGIALLDARGRLITANPSLCRMLGYDAEELLGKISTDLLSSDSQAAVARLYRELKSGKRKTGFMEESYIRKDGRILWAMASHSLIRDSAGDPKFYIDLIQDITELKQVREENETLEKQLQQAQKMEAIGTLAGGIAHDFNNILMAIIGYTELAIMYSQSSDSSLPMLEQVLQSANRAAGLVKQILTFSRQDLQEKQPVELIPLVKEALKLIRATFPAGIRIEEDYEDQTKMIMADPTQIHQVVMNLCTNAYHAMQVKEAGILRVEVKYGLSLPAHLLKSADTVQAPCEQWLRLTVADNGCGINARDLPRIFDPYFTTKPTGEGTGLGLSVVHGIMEKIGGCIDIRSRQGEGTAVDLYFPVHQETMRDTGESNDYAVLSGKERVMLVDDEESILSVGRAMLERLGYQVETFSRPDKALESFRAQPDAYDLILTDKNMPGINGDDLASAMMAMRPDLPVLIASGFHGASNTESSACQSSRLQYIQKPLGYKELSKSVRDMLDSEKEQ